MGPLKCYLWRGQGCLLFGGTLPISIPTSLTLLSLVVGQSWVKEAKPMELSQSKSCFRSEPSSSELTEVKDVCGKQLRIAFSLTKKPKDIINIRRQQHNLNTFFFILIFFFNEYWKFTMYFLSVAWLFSFLGGKQNLSPVQSFYLKFHAQERQTRSTFVLTHQPWHTQITSFKFPQSHAPLSATQIVEQAWNKTALFHPGDQ